MECTYGGVEILWRETPGGYASTTVAASVANEITFSGGERGRGKEKGIELNRSVIKKAEGLVDPYPIVRTFTVSAIFLRFPKRIKSILDPE